MLNKDLIKKNFQKSITTYNNNAIVQKKMAQKLVSFLNSKNYDNILEIGSYSGILTSEIVKNINFKRYLALDIINSFENIKNLSPKIKFIQGDIEKIALNGQFDLIISNASLQWCEDFNLTITKLISHLTPNGTLAISTFADKNLIEIKNAFNLSLNYKSLDELKETFPNAQIIEEIETLEFKNPIDVLKHLKLTGVNSLTNKPLSIQEVKKGLKKLENKLTYDVVYLIFHS